MTSTHFFYKQILMAPDTWHLHLAPGTWHLTPGTQVAMIFSRLWYETEQTPKYLTSTCGYVAPSTVVGITDDQWWFIGNKVVTMVTRDICHVSSLEGCVWEGHLLCVVDGGFLIIGTSVRWNSYRRIRSSIHPCHSTGEVQPYIKSGETAGKWIQNVNN